MNDRTAQVQDWTRRMVILFLEGKVMLVNRFRSELYYVTDPDRCAPFVGEIEPDTHDELILALCELSPEEREEYGVGVAQSPSDMRAWQG